MNVERRRLTPVETSAGTLFGVLRQGPAAERAMAFFASGASEAALEDGPWFRITHQRQINGGLMVEGLAAGGHGPVRLPLAGQNQSVEPDADDAALFAGLNTALSVCNGQSAEMVLDWLDYHARDHGLQAALIIDRAPPEAPSGLARALAAAEVPGIERVVVLEPGIAVGKPGTGPEGDRYYAPDAPGRDRMTEPGPDPWRAPFGEFILYEYLRHRFLSAARAVTNIDVADLLAPGDGPNVFDRAAAAPEGLVPLSGIRIYPWARRKDHAPAFSDHICLRFDGGPGNPRWCVAPARLPEGAVWRLIRVVGASAEPGEAPRYWRAMSLRHPDEKVASIVPKTSLIEDPELLALSLDRFGGNPVRAPEEKLKPLSRRGTGGGTGIVTTMKNEGPFILEWIAYHRAIGVDKFLVYTNDCSDGTDALLDLLQARGLIEHRENPFRGTDLKPQHAALQAAEDEPLIQGLEWLVCMDVDEFINIHVGEGRLKDLYAAVPDANLISMNWRLFGNADVQEFHDGFITEQFTACAPEFCRKPHQAWGFKTLTRNLGLFKKFGVHRPKGLKPQLVDEVRWVNGSGKPLPRTMYRNAWRSTTETYGYDLVTLNHYAVRSAESFLVKRDRGRVNHVNRDQGTAYWFRMNNNGETDLSIQARLPAARAEFERLMADPEIAAQHAACVAAHRRRIDELMAMPNYAALYAELTGERLQRLSRMHGHFGAGVFLAGPDVIPDEVAASDPEPDFFFTVERAAQAH